MNKKILPALIAVVVVASACSSDETSSTRATLPEEVTIPSNDSSTTEQQDLGPLPEAEWEDVELINRPIASFDSPTVLTVRPGERDLWIAERGGKVKRIKKAVEEFRQDKKIAGTDGTIQSISETEYLQATNETLLDISGKISTSGEGGLLGMAFSNNGSLLYLNYTNNSGDTIVAEYKMIGDIADPASERVLLEVDQPFDNHNGGQLTIGTDGFLYIALGDGGSSGDPQGHGQDTQTLLGSILRIDPDERGADAYSIPDGNPFKNDEDEGRKEIWLWGVRNPWRFSFDADTGDMWIGDVGQNEREEITFLPKRTRFAGQGANLGWNLVEGDRAFNDAQPPDGHVGPLHTYQTRDNGTCSVVGGYVYRGEQLAFRINGLVDKPFEGVYIYGDYCASGLTGLERLDDGRILVRKLNLDVEPKDVISFGEGPEKEIYVLEQGGQVSRLEFPNTARQVLVLQAGESFPDISLPQDQQVTPGDPVAGEEPGEEN